MYAVVNAYKGEVKGLAFVIGLFLFLFAGFPLTQKINLLCSSDLGGRSATTPVVVNTLWGWSLLDGFSY